MKMVFALRVICSTLLLVHVPAKRIQNYCSPNNRNVEYDIMDDGNAKEKVTLKMTSKYFKLLRDSFN